MAVAICDAVMAWMVKRELIDWDQEYHPAEIVEALEGIFTDPTDEAPVDVGAAVAAEIDRLRPHYQGGSMLDVGRRQLLDHFERFIR